jgi:hypothetical protein
MVGCVMRTRVTAVRLVVCLASFAWFTTLTVGSAEADVLAAVQVQPPGGRSDFDIAVLDASTGVRLPLPAGVNTTADELHPSISADGSRLVFQRRDSATGTERIIAVDLKTGQSSDLFTGFEVSQKPPTGPAITPDGQTVVTGGPFVPVNGAFEAEVTLTSLTPFPSGPYAHENPQSGWVFQQNGQVADVAPTSDGDSVMQTISGATSRLVVTGPNEDLKGSQTLINPDAFDDPALAASNPQFVLFVRRNSVNLFSAPGDIEFLPLTFDGIQGTPTSLPAVVDTPMDESQPAVTADGRFVAFVRHGSDGHDRLFLWDSQTQLLLNSKGVDLGAIDSHDLGSLSLYTKPVFSNGHVIVQASQSALAAFVARSGEKGILVQRIVGRQRILGRREYRLRTVGRVPLGRFTNGHHRVHWDLRVNGRRLRRGRYLVTLRALSREGVVRDLAKPDAIRVR